MCIRDSCSSPASRWSSRCQSAVSTVAQQQGQLRASRPTARYLDKHATWKACPHFSRCHPAPRSFPKQIGHASPGSASVSTSC
eukprot:4782954-Alexandrium_andersonii.AAC.1